MAVARTTATQGVARTTATQGVARTTDVSPADAHTTAKGDATIAHKDSQEEVDLAA